MPRCQTKGRVFLGASTTLFVRRASERFIVTQTNKDQGAGRLQFWITVYQWIKVDVEVPVSCLALL
jgi:hypothetical protein